MIKKTLIIIGLLVFIFKTEAQDWKEISKVLPIPYMHNSNDFFGRSVSIDGDYAVVGAYRTNTERGCAYVMHNNGSEWTKIAVLTSSDSKEFDWFGVSVDINEGYIVVGANQRSDNDIMNGAAYIFKKPDEGWINMTETAKLEASYASNYNYFGRSVSISGNHIVVGANGAEKAYVFTKPDEGWINTTESAILSDSDNNSSYGFGMEVKIEGNSVVVGNPYDKSSTGSAYVFEKPTGGWTNMTETAKLTTTDGESYDYFGFSIGFSNECIVVGADKHDDNGSNSGASYVYEKPITGWIDMTQTAKLTASNASSDDVFGCSVSINEDVILIGASEANFCMGGAYLFEKPANGWSDMTETYQFTTVNCDGADGFGSTVLVSNEHAFVGAESDATNGIWSGSLLVYEKPTTGWTNLNESYKIFPEPYLQNSLDHFGNAVSIYGDYAVVGANGYMSNQGCAYILQKNEIGWENIALLTTSDGENGDELGISVSIYGDLVIVGAKNNNNSGACYVYKKPFNGWGDMTETAKLIASDGAYSDKFGNSVGIFDTTIVVGAFYDNDNGSYSGSAYIFEKPAGNWVNMTETAKLLASDGTSSSQFGSSVSIFENTVLVGAFGDDANGPGSGCAYVFEKPLEGWTNMTENAILTASEGQGVDHFGYSVSAYNDVCLIGAYGDDNWTGSAYVFEKPSSGWSNMTETAKLIASDRENSDEFGYSVSIYEDICVVGSFWDNVIGYNEGSAYLYTKPNDGWANMTETKKITASDGLKDDYFGKAVSIYGDYLISGSYSDDNIGSRSGSAYVFYSGINVVPDEYSNVCPNESIALSVEDDNTFDYQWQVSEDVGVSFSNISDNSTYSGTNTESLTIIVNTDINGNYYRCSVSSLLYNGVSNAVLVTVDTEAPEITSTHTDQSIGDGIICEVSLPDYTANITASDNCDGNLDVTQNPTAGTIISGSTNQITLTVTDDEGNYDNVFFNVEVVDNTNPVITCVSNKERSADETHTYTVSGTEFDPTETTDNCSVASIENDYNNASTLNGASLTEGTTIIEWTIIDNSGNINNCSFDVLVNAYVGVENMKHNSVSIYPNPTNGIINVELSNNNTHQLTISDIMGKILVKRTTDEQNKTINLSNFESGIYIISIQTDKEIFKTKIIKR